MINHQNIVYIIWDRIALTPHRDVRSEKYLTCYCWVMKPVQSFDQ